MGIGLLPPVVAELLMDIKEFKASANEAEAKMGGLTKSGSAMFDKIGKATVLGVAGIGIASVKMAADFETNMTRLYTAAGAPKEAVKGAYGEVLKLGDAVGYSGTAMAEALYHPVSAGLDLKTSLQAVKYSAEEAQISGASLDDTTYSLSSVMKAFNQNADQAHDTMALLNSIVGQGDMRFQDFNVSVKNWAPTAAQMGISIQSMGAALAYLTDRGNSAEEASTRVTMGLTMMAYPSQKAGQILQGLGVDTADVTASTESMTAVMRKTGITQNQLAEDLKKPDGIYVALKHVKAALDAAGVSGTEADAMLSKVFGGGRSDKAILSLLQNLDGLKGKFDDIGKGAGTFDQAWADTQQTFSFKMKKLGADAENFGIQLGLKLIPAIEATVGWFARNKLAVEALATIITGVLVVSTLKWISTLTGSFVSAVAKAVVSIKSIGVASEEAAVKQAAATTAAGNWGRTLGNSIPIFGAVIAGAAALGNWLGHLGDKTVDAAAVMNQLNNGLLDLANNSATQASGQIMHLADAAMKVGGSFRSEMIDPIDKGLAGLVSGGHIDQARQALASIDAELTAGGKNAGEFNSKLKDYNDAVGAYGVQQREAALDTKNTTGALKDTAGALDKATTAADGTADSINKVDDAFTTLSGRITASGALHNFQKDLLSVSDELKNNGKAFNENSLDGLKNMEAFRDAAGQISAYRDAQIKNGVTTDDANKKAADQAKSLIDVWEKLTGNKKAVDDYAKALGLVPKELATNVTVKQSDLDAAIRKLGEINALRVQAGAPYVAAPGGGRAALATGGPVRGPGTSTSDSVPIAASNGEFMINAAAASRLGTPFLNALNSGSVPAAPASGYGGFGANTGTGGGNAPTPVINVYLDGHAVNGAVRAQTLRYDQRNSGNNLTLAGRGFQ